MNIKVLMLLGDTFYNCRNKHLICLCDDKRSKVLKLQAYVGGVDGLQADEDVVKVCGPRLEVGQILSPASS